MKNQKFWKFSLPALLMSAFAFETMPGSVRYYAADLVQAPEVAFNFFNLQLEHSAAACLPLAGIVTLIAMGMAILAAFSKKYPIFKMISWTSLAAAALSAAPYVVQSENGFLHPNVVVTILLTACWLIGMMLDKKKDAQQEKKPEGRRL